jgi:hypothetical protein
LSAFGKPEAEFRRTVQTRRYPRIRDLRKSILCVDGRQRLAAARREFGKKSWWTAKLYSNLSHPKRFSFQTKYSDSEIYWHFRNHNQSNETDPVKGLNFELSPSKERILKSLLKVVPGEICGNRERIRGTIVNE